MRAIIQSILLFIFFTALQVFFLRRWVLFDYALCFGYTGFLIFLPESTGKIVMLILAFLVGIAVDIFYSSYGIHASACVAAAYVMPFIAKLLKPSDADKEFSIKNSTPIIFLEYVLIFELIHHSIVFFVNAAGHESLTSTLIKIGSGVLFTTVFLLILRYLMFAPKKAV